MSEKKREIEDWERAECLALKAAVDDFNKGKSRKDSLSQGKIADALEISQGAVSSYLNGYNALNARFASVVAGLLGVPVESFSPRLSKEIAAMAAAAHGGIGNSPRSYQDDLYEAAPAEQRADVDEVADMMLRLTPEQARKLKQAMDLLIPDNGTAKD
ncbi:MULTISPECIES: helix-turn-helix transcriptional regulator [unclassified Pseudomonas]|uniref:helix-turn-helix domain-containing protein n=1 Tax=unclassified Pseudomonas TaxID=196821 RepID=UPI00244927E8|nr:MULTISPECIES: helix-turn-helix transcriptional regulator [unclassified Pseudomonas]MDG9928285.1 helix-turn-helix transcriptional regulator [Pseudomonas sp. GD04042]MDH0481151.1 helix-turn-helix transcriptional regulator [Pseudomonas sp. GD04015]MDH0604487.1 helix-turn-helix transcriptional regulator [Pseudomonas sp. GD03869]